MSLDLSGDRHPGERGLAEAAERYTLQEVTGPGPAFDDAWRALSGFFGPRNEIERRDVLERWLVDPVTDGPIRVRYHLVVARAADGSLAGARDCFVTLDGERCVVLLSHSLVEPAHRRSGLAGLLRTAPAALARRAVAEAGMPPETPILLVAEMEPVDPGDPGSLVRLLAYGRAGYVAVPPAAMPYCQPDFRDLDALGEDQRPIPMVLVARWLGREGAPIPKAHVEGIVRSFRAIHLRACRRADLDALLVRALAALAAYPADPVPVLPLAGDAADVLAPLLKSRVLGYYPEAWRGPVPDAADEHAALVAAAASAGPGRGTLIPGG